MLLDKGMNLESNTRYQPQGTWRKAVNMLLEDGFLIPTNEPGFSKLWATDYKDLS